MRFPQIYIFTLLASAGVLLAACAGNPVADVDRGDGLAMVDARTRAALNALRKSPAHVIDRQEFHRSADGLAKLLAKLPDNRAPRDSAVLVYLARLARGDIDGADYLSLADAEQVLRLCGPSHLALRRAALRVTGDRRDEMLRQSCFTWLVGDAAKSRALFLRARTEGVGQGPALGETPLDAFFLRLQASSGIDLAARENAGGQGAQPPVAGRSSASGDWVGRANRP